MINKGLQRLDGVKISLQGVKKGVELLSPDFLCAFRLRGNVMEKNDIPCFESVKDAVRQIVDFFISLVKGPTTEGDGEQSFIKEHLFEAWIGDSCRWPEEEGMNAAVLQDFLSPVDILLEFLPASQHE